jgi:hypothetical protein
MKKKFEDITYFLTVWFCVSLIVLWIIGIVFTLISKC